MSAKSCSRCKSEFPLESFSKNKNSKDGRHCWCGACQWAYEKNRLATEPEYRAKRRQYHKDRWFKTGVARESYLRRVFGISIQEYETILEGQGSRCAICQTRPGTTRTTRLFVDHDHLTGEVRGLLCMKCNHGIGQFADSPERLARAIAYLERLDHYQPLTFVA